MTNCLRLCILVLTLVIGLGKSGYAQLRIIDYNTAGITNSSAMTTVLQAMNNEMVNGVAKPIDAMILQELSGGDIATMTTILNSFGVGTYVASNVGSTTGAGGVGLVYRTESLDLVAQSQVVDTSSSGAARGVMRFTLRPDGYGDEANFYIYGSHYKSSDSTSDANRRNVEAAAIRANSDALGDGAHIIYAGDFNIYRSSEPMWATLTGAGNGQAFDPVNQVGSWHDGSSFISVHTQNPAGSGFVGGGMDDRFDWQMVTGEMLGNEGMSLLTGSYHAFGNNGTHTMNGHINTGTGAAAAVLNALGSASDHLPVMAQYQVPAKMSVAVTDVPSRVLVGTSLNATVNVANSAGDGEVVVTLLGADELDYSVTGTGAASGSVNGIDSAFGGSNDHAFSLDTSMAGAKTASFTTQATSPQVPNPTSLIDRSYSVLDHASPSFDGASEIASLMYDFGSVVAGSAFPEFSFDLFNFGVLPEFTADLDFDGVLSSGDANVLTTNLDIAAGMISLVAGESQSFLAMLDTATPGDFSATYTLSFSDEDLAGAVSKALTLTLIGEVLPGGLDGDFNKDGFVDAADYTVWRDGLGTTYTPEDYDVWRMHFGESTAPTAGAAVPEASAAILVATALFSVGIIRRVRVGR